jgi:cytochrome c-type biogenesis protein CcmE
MNPLRRRRLVVILLGVAAVGIAAMLVLLALRQNIQHFVSPSDIAAGKAAIGQRIRIGGIVEEGSLKRGDSDALDVQFVVTDRFQTTRVHFNGILPDLFREGQSVVATGQLADRNLFQADEVLAKHDENYMPAEVSDAIARAKIQKQEAAR